MLGLVEHFWASQRLNVEAIAVLDDVMAKIKLEKLGDVLSRTHQGKV